MPAATTATNTAISLRVSTLRRMTISGNDSAVTLIMKASTVPSAAPLPSSASTTGMMPAALEYIGTPISDDRRHRPPRALAHDRGEQVVRHVAVDEGAGGDADDDPDPDAADDVAHRVEPRADAVDDARTFGRQIGRAGAHVAHPFLEPAFEMQTADDPAGDDGHRQSEPEIGRGDLPAHKREQEPQRDLVDHRRGDQEREGDAERHAGRHEADEQRHGGARAERA